MLKNVHLACLLALSAILLDVAPARYLPAQASSPTPKTLGGAVPSVVAAGQASLIGIHDQSSTITLAVGLTLHNRAALDQLLGQTDRPPLSLDDANNDFNPTADDEARVTSWLQSQRLTVTHTYPNHLMVDVAGTVADVDRAFHVVINDYAASIGGHEQTFYAPAQNPTVDAAVSDVVDSIVGLDDIPRFHSLSNGSTRTTAPYFPQNFADAYDLDPLWSTGADGAGQHIGITMWSAPPTTMTLQYFGTITGASVPTTANGHLKVIPVDGGTTVPDTGETGMDIEYSSGLAPGATIDYYEAPTDNSGNPTNQGLLDALNLAGSDANDNRQISNSWGECEADSASDQWTTLADNIFASNGATGHSYIFASGDSGSWCDPKNDGTGINPYPVFPASSPYVVSVGGSRFSSVPDSGYPGETAWNYCANCNGGHPSGSGGGYSSLFSRPAWQVGGGLAANGKRGYPDLALDADSTTGADVCYGALSTCMQLGGTSLASPLLAGIMASVNSFLLQKSKLPVSGLTSVIYQLAATAQTYAPFHDIISGTNGKYSAGAGWDAVTGWGSPDGYNLARDLLTVADSSNPTPTPTGNSGRSSRVNKPPVAGAAPTPVAGRAGRLTPTPVLAGATPTPTPVGGRRHR